MARPKSKQYRITNSFTYKGPKGSWKQKDYVRIGPGQEIPKLESSEIERLLHEGKLCEMDVNGESIPNDKFIEMNAEQVDRLCQGKSELAVINIVRATNFGIDTLNRILVFAERNKLNQAAHLIDEQLSKLAAA